MIAELEKPPQLPGRRPWYRWEAAVVAAIAAAMLLLVTTSFTAGRDIVWIDPVTGSIKTETRWFGRTTQAVIKPSAIETWMNGHGAPHSNHWKHLHETFKTVFGQTIGCGCSVAPAIYPLHAGSLDECFIRNSADEEIDEFVRIMRSGTEDLQQRAVKVALDRNPNSR